MWESFRYGLSAYTSTFGDQAERLALLPQGNVVYTSLHYQEEVGDGYRTDTYRMLKALRDCRLRVVADVSPRTLAFFGLDNLAGFARENGIACLRLDYGFTDHEMAAIAAILPVALNATTVSPGSAARIREASPHEICAIHNFYPRPETGLDREFFLRATRDLQAIGIKVFAFIAGDVKKRGPVFEGLPTLEAHRDTLPGVACLELLSRYGLDGVFVGDMEVSPAQSDMILDYIHDGEIRIPCSLYSHLELYDRPLAVRADSPSALLRLSGLRDGDRHIEPANTAQRSRGSITLDNCLYSRYSGEIQLIRQPLPADRRVNVIGNIDSRYLRLLDCVKNGGRIRLVRSW